MIEETRGRPLSNDERTIRAIDLAKLLLTEARRIETHIERRREKKLATMMADDKGKALSVAITDQAFRSQNHARIANQIHYLLDQYDMPDYLGWGEALGLRAVAKAPFLVPQLTHAIRRQTEHVVLPGEDDLLLTHLKRRKKEGIRVNLNRLGEAILGEEEASKRLQLYLSDLEREEVDTISVKVSTLCSQLNLIAYDETLERLAEALRTLYRKAGDKLVNLDMEEFRDLDLTVDLFCKVLSETEFLHSYGGIVLQAYIPESYDIYKRLSIFAEQRIARGGAPIRIRIVKGANLAMEQVEASIAGFNQAPYTSKIEVDANFRRMLLYAAKPHRVEAAHIGVASHNLFDIAHALLIRSERRVEEFITFEMLEGMADPIRRVVQALTGDILLYCPAARGEEFLYAIGYLIRRLDENTGRENFLRHVPSLQPDTPTWEEQAALFREGCKQIEQTSSASRRGAHREPDQEAPFDNEPNTDWAIESNRLWARRIVDKWACKAVNDPPTPNVKQALQDAKQAEASWASQDRLSLMAQVARLYRHHRADLIGVMMADGKKTLAEADAEVSEAIDFIEYYRRSYPSLSSSFDVKPLGTILVTPPWNFPCAIPTGGISAALVTGNCVIFKPAPETAGVGWELAKLFWEAGVPKEVLQYLSIDEEPFGSALIQNPGINGVILTGATSTAKKFLQLRPDLKLMAETGGKNSIIVTNMADRDLAIRDTIASAFSHAGQKCSAASLLILHHEVYDDAHFLEQLRDATASLPVGSQWDLDTRVNPLIESPSVDLKRALTTLDQGEEWLVEPVEQAPDLWSPGIKLGVEMGSYSHQTEFFGPVLGVMRANSLEEAISFANGTPYGLTAGLHSLDDREIAQWCGNIEAGNLYVNRGITGAIVRRQPFGGCKASSFGKGCKAGGPHYLHELVTIKASADPTLETSIESYTEAWEQLRTPSDPSQLLGQANYFYCVPRAKVILRIQEGDAEKDVLRSMAAAKVCGCPLEVSVDPRATKWDDRGRVEEENVLIKGISNKTRIRLLSSASDALLQGAAEHCAYLAVDPVLALGKWELLHYVREVAISIDFHRYGNLYRKRQIFL